MNITSARKAAEFAQIIDRDRMGRVSCVHVHGHDGREYQVEMTRGSKGIAAWCYRLDRSGSCPGNSNGHICYHVLAAVLVAVEAQKMKVSFCDSQTKAENLANLGGEVVQVRSMQGKGRLWVVARSKKQAEQETAESGSVSAAQEFKALWDRMMKPERLSDDELARYAELDRQFALKGWNAGRILNEAQREIEEAKRENTLPVNHTRGRNKLFKS